MYLRFNSWPFIIGLISCFCPSLSTTLNHLLLDSSLASVLVFFFLFDHRFWSCAFRTSLQKIQTHMTLWLYQLSLAVTRPQRQLLLEYPSKCFISYFTDNSLVIFCLSVTIVLLIFMTFACDIHLIWIFISGSHLIFLFKVGMWVSLSLHLLFLTHIIS